MKTSTIKQIIGVSLIGGAILVASLASAQTSTALSATCSGAVVSNVITWTVSGTGGTAPYTNLWTGDGIGGVTSTSVAATFTANGTRSASVLVKDSATSTASVTATCSASVTSFTTTSTPPSVPPARFKPAMLSIEPSGHITARGMIVTSVGTNSFQAQVWGITYTVNWSGHLVQFFFRNKEGVTSTPEQVSVGDEVGVSGKINSASPLVINADVVRDYSLVNPHALHGNQGDNNGKKDENENHGNSTSTEQIRGHLNDLLKQLQDIQGKFKLRFGGGN